MKGVTTRAGMLVVFWRWNEGDVTEGVEEDQDEEEFVGEGKGAIG